MITINCALCGEDTSSDTSREAERLIRVHRAYHAERGEYPAIETDPTKQGAQA